MTNTDLLSPLIEPEDLLALLKDASEKVKPIDATFVMAGAAYSPLEFFSQARIGNAAFFDIDKIADQTSDLPHMVPSPADFARAISQMGIKSTDHIVVYDQFGIAMAAARAWWMFRLFGHANIQILNGGLPYWHATGFPLNSEPPAPAQPLTYKAEMNSGLLADRQDIQMAVKERSSTIIDARSAERFSGAAREPRMGMRQGHIPGSCNIPFTDLLDASTGRLLDQKNLSERLGSVNLAKPLIASCGSGVTACVTALAFAVLGRWDVAVYDGSWAEWGQVSQEDLPVKVSL